MPISFKVRRSQSCFEESLMPSRSIMRSIIMAFYKFTPFLRLFEIACKSVCCESQNKQMPFCAIFMCKFKDSNWVVLITAIQDEKTLVIRTVGGVDSRPFCFVHVFDNQKNINHLLARRS